MAVLNKEYNVEHFRNIREVSLCLKKEHHKGTRMYERRILRVLSYIHDNLDGDLSLDALADVAAMSRYHWHRVFHAMSGETSATAIRRIRLNRAAQLLLQTDRTLADIAKACGYSNIQSFTQIFRTEYGVPPGAFRKHGGHAPVRQNNERANTMYTVEIETHAERRLAALPHAGAYQDIGMKFEALSGIFSARHLWRHAGHPVGVYYDDAAAVPTSDLRSHAGFIVQPDFKIPENLEEVIIAAGRSAVLHYKGPYAGLKDAYRYLYGEWLAGSGVELRDAPAYSLVLNSPRDNAPNALLTDICLPIV